MARQRGPYRADTVPPMLLLPMRTDPVLYAVRLPAILTPESQESYVFVGVRCALCGVAYSVAMPNAQEQYEFIPEAVQWAEKNMGECGAHPAVLYAPDIMSGQAPAET